MIDACCLDCQQTTGGCWRHRDFVIPPVTVAWPSPPLASATTDDILVELQKLRASLDTTLRTLSERLRDLEQRVYGDPRDE